MSLTGGASIKSLLHDLVESLQHKLDKLALGGRKLYDFLLVPKDRAFEFQNRFPILEDSGIYLLAPPVEAARQDGDPKDWDKDGTLASFSAGSEVAELRRFLQDDGEKTGNERKRRGKAKADGKRNDLPPPPPDDLGREFQPVSLEEVESGEYLSSMLTVRAQSDCYHRQAAGAGSRIYWKKCPVTTRTVDGDDVGVGLLLEPLGQALQLAKDGDEAGLKKLIEEQKSETDSLTEERPKKVVGGVSDLRRYTINVGPALARAMALMLEHGGDQTVVRDLMVENAPLIAAEFERVTGRKVVGVSIHFDSNLPHWNLWHSGLEPVLYRVGESERTRFRRTAMNLNASGNMLAWDRVSRAFTRIGEDFRDVSVATANELEKAESRALERQGRAPGDFTLNRKADKVLESALKELGYDELIDRGYQDFVENEKKRYATAIAGRDGKDLKKIIDALPVEPAESPLEATQRLVNERDRIDRALKSVPGVDTKDLASAVDNLVERVSFAQSNERNLRGVLEAEKDETLVDAATRMNGCIDKLTEERDYERDKAVWQHHEQKKLTDQIAEIELVLKPNPGEGLLAAARRLAARAMEAISLKAKAKKIRTEGEELCVENAALTRQVGELEKQLGSEQEKVRRLEEEITPLRVLRDRVKELLKELKASPLAQKFDECLKSLLREVGKLVGIAFAPGKKEPAPEVDQSN